MQNENDHIEELFRRAAESYPLKTSGSNWNEVASKLNFKKDKKDKPLFIFFNDNKYAFSIVFLLLLGSIFYLIYSSNSNQALLKKHNKIEESSLQSVAKSTEGQTINEDVKKTSNSKQLVVSLHNNSTLTPLSFAKKINDIASVTNFNHKRVKARSVLGIAVLTPQSEILNSTGSGENNETLIYNVASPIHESFDIAPTTPFTLNDKTGLLVTSAQSDLKELIHPAKANKKWRLSFLTGIDRSNIKQQQYSHTGWSFGATIGYTVHHFLVETGLIYDKKYYYSSGKYFNPKVAINPYWNITDLTGFCNMFEIPINLGYTLNVNWKNNIVFKTGLSSYLMNHETYDYNYTSYGMSYPATASYKSGIKNWFAVTNLSVNYNRRLTFNTTIGIEPYLKIPVNNIGTGRMPIASYGINMLISKKF